MANVSRLFFRKNNSNASVTGGNLAVSPIERGLALCWNYNASKTAYAHLVRKGSAHGGSGLFVRHKGIDFEVSPNAPNTNYRLCLDDCGGSYEIGTGVTGSPDGWYFGSTGVTGEDTSVDVALTKPFTIAFKVKGSSSTGSDGPGHILTFSSSGSWIIGDDPYMGEVFSFGLRSNGQLFFHDYFVEMNFSGSKTEWRDFKITFYPTDTITYVSSIGYNCRLVNITAVCNGVTQNAATYYVDDSTGTHHFKFNISDSRNRLVKGQSDFTRVLYGWLQYISVAQDEIGYSDYKRDSHLALLYFD